MRQVARQDGQAPLMLVAAMAATVVGAVLLGGIAQGIGNGGREQRAADLGALAGAPVMHEAFDRLFEPPTLDDAGPNPRHLEAGAFKQMDRRPRSAWRAPTAARTSTSSSPTATPSRPRAFASPCAIPQRTDGGGHHHEAPIKAAAEAELAPTAQIPTGIGDAGQYNGPFAFRQGKPMRYLFSTRSSCKTAPDAAAATGTAIRGAMLGQLGAHLRRGNEATIARSRDRRSGHVAVRRDRGRERLHDHGADARKWKQPVLGRLRRPG
jgi:hypothetical protein